MTAESEIRRASIADADAASLIAALNAELRAQYPEAGANHFALSADEIAPGRGAFLLALHGAKPVGCGAVRLLDSETAELKRMYVTPAARGLGIGRQLVAALEAEAAALGARRLVLETGSRQTAALALYARCGFEPIELYGEYRDSPRTSVCLGKRMSPSKGNA